MPQARSLGKGLPLFMDQKLFTDQMPDSESCSVGYEVRYCRLMTRANLTMVESLRFRLKEICVRICTFGQASVHLLSF